MGAVGEETYLFVEACGDGSDVEYVHYPVIVVVCPYPLFQVEAAPEVLCVRVVAGVQPVPLEEDCSSGPDAAVTRRSASATYDGSSLG